MSGTGFIGWSYIDDLKATISHQVDQIIDLRSQLAARDTEIVMLKAERDVFSGVSCSENAIAGRGFCGICRECYRAETVRLSAEIAKLKACVRAADQTQREGSCFCEREQVDGESHLTFECEECKRWEAYDAARAEVEL